MAEVSALELIGLVGRELLDRERELAVVVERLDQVGGEVSGMSAVSVRPSSPTTSSRRHGGRGARGCGRGCRQSATLARSRKRRILPGNHAAPRLVDARASCKTARLMDEPPLARARCAVELSPGAATQGIGGVAASIDCRNLHHLRAIGRVGQRIDAAGAGAAMGHVVQHLVERRRAPLWKKVCGNANSDSSDGGTKPSAPSGAARVLRGLR